MSTGSIIAHREGLKIARLLMVLSSFSPLFILWAIRGNNLIPDRPFVVFCALMVIVPNASLWLRISIAKKQFDKRELVVGKADDHRDHILVYLFAMLLPLYSANMESLRELVGTVVAVVFVVFLFWHLNLHYMNLVFAVLGYRVFTVYPPTDGSPLTGRIPRVIITRRVSLASGDRVVAYRLSDTVYVEAEG